jgi:DNA-binding transcriptional LysR family regulator
MDRLKALATFKTVVDKGGFARAAAELDMSCAAVTRAVQELEMLLGVRLLQRTTRRVTLTAVGQEVLTHAIELLDGYDALTALSSLSASEPAGTVRLSAPAAYARHFVGPALAPFLARHPKVWVDLRMREGAVDVVADEVDLALCLSGDLNPSLVARRVCDFAVGLFASHDYLRHRGIPDHPDELLAHSCLVCDESGSSHWQFRHRSGVEIDLPIKGAMRCSQAEVLVGAAVHGAGIVLLPVFMARDAVEAGLLQRLLPDWTCPPLALQLAYSSRRNQPLAVRKLIEHLVHALRPADDAAPCISAPAAAYSRRPASRVPQAVALAA